MSSIASTSTAPLGLNTATAGQYRARNGFDGARGLAAMLLAAAVAALVVLADRFISTWADGHLLLAWVLLWVVIFAGLALFAGTARTLARRTLISLDGWSQSLAEARAEARLWAVAQQDPRVMSELMMARMRAAEEAAQAAEAAAPVAAAARNDFSDALAPMGLETGVRRRLSEMARRRNAGYLPYL